MSYSDTYRRILGRMGYYDYQSGLIYRHLKQESGWDSHLNRCREYVLRTIRIHKPEKITVLGSGWLLELPVAEISEKVSELVLVDIVHPPDVIQQVRTLKNVKIIESDVSGGLIEEVYRKVKATPLLKRLDNLDGLVIPDYLPDGDPGIVISMNLLTQLEVLPVRFLEKKARISSEEMLEFRKKVQQKHLEFLSRHRSVLVSDYEEVSTSKSGETNSVRTLVADLPDGFDVEKWTWNFDLKGSDFYNSRSVMKVVAMTL